MTEIFLYARLTIRVICMLRNSCVRFVKTNPQASEELKITLSTNCLLDTKLLQLKMANLNDLVDFLR